MVPDAVQHQAQNTADSIAWGLDHWRELSGVPEQQMQYTNTIRDFLPGLVDAYRQVHSPAGDHAFQQIIGSLSMIGRQAEATKKPSSTTTSSNWRRRPVNSSCSTGSLTGWSPAGPQHPARIVRMSLDPKLLEVLACPRDRGPLTYLEEDNVLVNERLGIAYRIDDDIPVLLVDEAVDWPAAD